MTAPQVREKGLWAYLNGRLRPYGRPVLVVLGWGVAMGGLALWAIFQGLLLPQFRGGPPPDIAATETIRIGLFYLGLFGVSILSGAIMDDAGRAIGGYLVAYVICAFITFEVLSAAWVPDSVFAGLNLNATHTAIALLASDWTFRALFPFPLFLGMLGSVLGAALSEKYLG